MALWRRRQQKQEAERRVVRGRIAQRLDSELSSLSTVTAFATFDAQRFSTATFFVRDATEILPADRSRAVVKRESKQPTLEPVLVDPPPLRPTRQFE